MDIPASRHLTPVVLDRAFNARRDELPAALRPPSDDELFGAQILSGMPFACGHREALNAILVDSNAIEIELRGVLASYLIFLHVAENVTTNYAPDFADQAVDGNSLGAVVSEYVLIYADGGHTAKPILRRFGIQQGTSSWQVPSLRFRAGHPSSSTRRAKLSPSATQLTCSHSATPSRCPAAELKPNTCPDTTPSSMLPLGFSTPSRTPTPPAAGTSALVPRDERSAVFAVTHTSSRITRCGRPAPETAPARARRRGAQRVAGTRGRRGRLGHSGVRAGGAGL